MTTIFEKNIIKESYNIDPTLFAKIWKLRPNEDQYFKAFGKTIKLPRRTVNYSYTDKAYKGFWGSEELEATEPPYFISEFLDNLGFSPRIHNNILINFYEGASDYIGKHKDKDKELVKDYKIYSLSLYENTDDYRTMIFRKKGEKHIIKLKHGDMITFNETINKHYTHEVSKKKDCGKRINITIRMFNH